jgi:hypothetical protein
MQCVGPSCQSKILGQEGTIVNLSREKRHLEPIRFTPHGKINNSRRNDETFNSVETGQCALIKEEEIFTNLMNLIKLMKETKFTLPGNPGYHSKYRWSFYETFGIPPYSKTDRCLINNYRTLFKRFNHRGEWRSWFRGNPSNNLLDWFFDTESDTCAFNVFTGEKSSTNLAKYDHDPQPNNLFLLINYKEPNIINDITNYKIHFMVEESYALYVLMKAMMIMHNRDKKRGLVRHLIGKILINFWASKYGQTGERFLPIHRNTFAPTVAIYTATDSAEETKELLEELLKAFPEHNEIGLMELGASNKIAYGNIRLNKLICYAQGDRGNKLRIKEKNSYEIFPEGSPYRLIQDRGKKMYQSLRDGTIMKNRPENLPPLSVTTKYAISEKLIPMWVKRMISKCSSSEGEINKRSQAFFGVNFCDKKYSKLPYSCNIEPVCYFSVNGSCLDPNRIEGIDGIENTDEFSKKSSFTGGKKIYVGKRKTRKQNRGSLLQRMNPSRNKKRNVVRAYT